LRSCAIQAEKSLAKNSYNNSLPASVFLLLHFANVKRACRKVLANSAPQFQKADAEKMANKLGAEANFAG
jgi:hypothetical protein